MKVQSRFDNKKIGELVCDGAMKFVQNFAVEINGERVAEYLSLDAVAKDWKDYKEPLIKDEKVRTAVKAWAEANGEDCYYIVSDYRINDGNDYSIEFYNSPFENLENRHYTIRELCGEEE